MRIVINAFSARRGGGKTYLSNILKYCPDQNGLHVTILASSKFDLNIDHPKVEIQRITFPVDNPIMRVIWEKFTLPHFLQKQKTDVLFCPGGMVPRSAFGGWKTVTMFRNMIPFDMKQRRKYPIGYMRIRNWLLKNSMLWSMKNSDLVIFISEFAKKIIDDYSGDGIKCAKVIPHGVGKEFSDRLVTEKLKPLFEGSYILYPSIIDVYKSQKEVVRAISILRDRGIIMPKLLLVGEICGNYGKEVQQLIRDLDLDRHIILTGPIAYVDMPLLYHRADFVIFASQSENCPNILLEALAAGCATLCSKNMPMPEFGGNAIEYFSPENPDELADKLEIFVTDTEFINVMKKRVIEIASYYSWERCAKQTWELLTTI